MTNPAPTQEFKVNDRRVINGWAMFDWANSAYALVITVAIFPIYFLSVTSDQLTIFGKDFPNSSVYAFSLSFAYILIALLSPLFSGMADFSGKRMVFLKFFTYLGGVACISLFFFNGGGDQAWIFGSIAFILATIGFAGGLVFYNAYLPEIVSDDLLDKVSARGFARGYIGSVLLLIVNLLMIQKPAWFGIPDGSLPARISFLMVGLWWIGFAQIPFQRLPPDKKGKVRESVLLKGYQEILDVTRRLIAQPNTLRFLTSFFFYSAGVQTVLYLAATFAEVELAFESSELIIMVLILQLVAIGGAWLFAWISGQRGNKFSLMIMLVIWMLICTAAYFVTEKVHFYFVAVFVGLVMGGIQSLSRSTYAKIIPDETKETTSYFSFYDVLEKFAIVSGTFIFGIAEAITGDMRNSVIALVIFFILGIMVLTSVKIRHAQELYHSNNS
jgi:UMF1 family MFS transporter